MMLKYAPRRRGWGARGCFERKRPVFAGARVRCAAARRSAALCALTRGAPLLRRKRSATDFSPVALAEQNGQAKFVATAASHDLRVCGEAAYLRDETLALLNTPMGGDTRAPQQWLDSME